MGSVFKKVQQVANLPHRLLLGKKKAASIDLGGQLSGAHDDLYKPENPEAIPQVDAEGEAVRARDRIRRMVSKAAGRDSTVRTSFAGALYDGVAKKLGGS